MFDSCRKIIVLGIFAQSDEGWSECMGGASVARRCVHGDAFCSGMSVFYNSLRGAPERFL